MSINNQDQDKLSQLYTEGFWDNLKAKTAATTQGVKNVAHAAIGGGSDIKNIQVVKFNSSINSLAKTLQNDSTKLVQNLNAIKQKMAQDSINQKLLDNVLQQVTALQATFSKYAPKPKPTQNTQTKQASPSQPAPQQQQQKPVKKDPTQDFENMLGK